MVGGTGGTSSNLTFLAFAAGFDPPPSFVHGFFWGNIEDVFSVLYIIFNSTVFYWIIGIAKLRHNLLYYFGWLSIVSSGVFTISTRAGYVSIYRTTSSCWVRSQTASSKSDPSSQLPARTVAVIDRTVHHWGDAWIVIIYAHALRMACGLPHRHKKLFSCDLCCRKSRAGNISQIISSTPGSTPKSCLARS